MRDPTLPTVMSDAPAFAAGAIVWMIETGVSAAEKVVPDPVRAAVQFVLVRPELENPLTTSLAVMAKAIGEFRCGVLGPTTENVGFVVSMIMLLTDFSKFATGVNAALFKAVSLMVMPVPRLTLLMSKSALVSVAPTV